MLKPVSGITLTRRAALAIVVAVTGAFGCGDRHRVTHEVWTLYDFRQALDDGRTVAVQLLCNNHSTMSAYVFVVDSPLYAKAQASGAFMIRGVPPGRYGLSAWHEAASTISRRTITVGADGLRDAVVAVGGDKQASPFVPDKYGHKRQPQLGY